MVFLCMCVCVYMCFLCLFCGSLSCLFCHILICLILVSLVVLYHSIVYYIIAYYYSLDAYFFFKERGKRFGSGKEE